MNEMEIPTTAAVLSCPLQRSVERPTQKTLLHQLPKQEENGSSDHGRVDFSKARHDEAATTPNGIAASKLCQAVDETALRRLKESKEILDCFDDPDRRLLLVEGPSGGTHLILSFCRRRRFLSHFVAALTTASIVGS
jgi:hypothetical protein